MEKRWGVKHPLLLSVAKLPVKWFAGTADSDFADGPAKGLTIAALMQGGDHDVVMAGDYVVYMGVAFHAVVSNDGATLRGLVTADDYNHHADI